MIQLIRENDKANIPIQEYVCDSVLDISLLPENVPFGSYVFVLEDKNVRIKNSAGTWVII